MARSPRPSEVRDRLLDAAALVEFGTISGIKITMNTALDNVCRSENVRFHVEDAIDGQLQREYEEGREFNKWGHYVRPFWYDFDEVIARDSRDRARFLRKTARNV